MKKNDLHNVVRTLRSIIRAQRTDRRYIDGEGFWRCGNFGRAAKEFGLDARGYVEFIRADSGAVIGVRPTAKALAFEARIKSRLELKWTRQYMRHFA